MPLIKGSKPGDSSKDEGKLKSALIKKGTVSYEPSPLWSAEEAARPKAPEKTVQVLKPQPESQAQVNLQEELSKVKEEAQKVVARAKAEAERIVAEAHNKAKKFLEQSKLYLQTAQNNAEREGYEQGHQEGREAGYGEFKRLMESARDLLQQLVGERERLARSAEQSLAKLAVKIAERVIAGEISLSGHVVHNMVKASLERVKDRDQVIIRVHPDDVETVKANREMFVQLVPGVRSLEIQGDNRIDRGSCMVETNLGTVDARISTQLEAIEAAFSKIEEMPEEVSDAENR